MKKIWAGVLIAAMLVVACAIITFHRIATQNVKPPGWEILNAPRVELRDNVSVTLMPGERKTIDCLLITRGMPFYGEIVIVRYIPKGSPEWHPPPKFLNFTYSDEWFPLPKGLKVRAEASQGTYEKRVVPIVIEAAKDAKPGCYMLEIIYPWPEAKKNIFTVYVGQKPISKGTVRNSNKK